MFSNLERVDIRTFLGYPNTFTGSNYALENAMDLVGSDPDKADRVRSILAKLSALDDAILEAMASAGIKKVDEVEFFGDKNGNATIAGLFKQGKAYVSRLSIMFGVGIASDYFGSKGYGGHGWGDRSYQIDGETYCAGGDIYSRSKG